MMLYPRPPIGIVLAATCAGVAMVGVSPLLFAPAFFLVEGALTWRVLLGIWVAVGLAGPIAVWIAWRREWRWAYLLAIAVILSPVALYQGVVAFFAVRAFLDR